MSTSLIKIPEQMAVAKKIDNVVSELFNLPIDTGNFQMAFMKASAYSLVMDTLDETYMKPIKTLCGTKIGFLTDKDREPTPYSDETIKSCVVEAILSGLEVTGNQFNIIQSKMYVTQQGFTALLKRLALRYNIDFTIPKTVEGATTVSCKITWEFNGNKGEKDISFPIKVQTGMGNDAILGKADRKAKKWLYLQLTNQDLGEGDAVDAEIVVVSSTPVGLNEEEQKRGDAHLSKAKTIEDLDKRLSQILDKHPNFSKDTYEELKKKLL